MKLLADECIEAEIVEALRKLGHDVKWMVDVHPGSLDPQVIAFARAEARIIVTHDVEFGSRVRQNPTDHSGFILVRLAHVPKAEIAAAVAKVIDIDPNWTNRFAVLKPTGVRFHPKL